MVNAVSSTPYYSYLNQLQTVAARDKVVPSSNAVALSTSNASAGDPSSLVSSLLGGDGFSPSVLSLLQENGSPSFDPLVNLLNASKTNTGAAKLYANIYSSSAASSLQQAKNDNPKQAAAVPSFTDSLISSSTQASIAYNQTLLQNTSDAAKAARAKTNSVISVIS